MAPLNRQWLVFSLCLAAALSGCSVEERVSTRSQIKALATSKSKTIDLSQVGPSSWARLCILAPYSVNETAEDLLGFEWDAEKETSIESIDSNALLVFASDNEVETYVTYSRGDGDFSPTGFESSCFVRDRAQFVRERDDEGRVSFVIAE